MMTRDNNITDLPNEILWRVSQHLTNVQDLGSLAKTNKQFKEFIIAIISSKKEYIVNNIGKKNFVWEDTLIMRIAAKKVLRERGENLLLKSLREDNSILLKRLVNIGMIIDLNSNIIKIESMIKTTKKCNKFIIYQSKLLRKFFEDSNNTGIPEGFIAWNLWEKYGYPAVVYAAIGGHTEIVKALIDKGANIKDTDVKLYNSYGTRILILTLETCKHVEIELLKTLINAGAQLNLQDCEGKTALMWAVTYGKIECVQFLINAGAQLNLQDYEGKTALINAVSRGNKEVVQIFLEAGAEVTIRDQNGHTALDWARFRGYEDIVELLRNKENGQNAARSFVERIENYETQQPGRKSM